MFRALQLEAPAANARDPHASTSIAPVLAAPSGVDGLWAYLGKPAPPLPAPKPPCSRCCRSRPAGLRPDRQPPTAARPANKVLDRLAAVGAGITATVADARIEQLQPPLIARCSPSACAAQPPKASTSRLDHRRDLQRTLGARHPYDASLPERRTSAALLVVENATMEARAYVGSVRFGDEAQRPVMWTWCVHARPDPALKPFLYGMAVDDG